MNIAKKVLPGLSLFLLCNMYPLTAPIEVQAINFLSPIDQVSLYMNTQVEFKDHGENLHFIDLRNGKILLMCEGSNNPYLTLENNLGVTEGVAYGITRFCTSDLSKVFYEITASTGAHGRACGYWIVGRNDGQWVTYVSLDNLATMGYTLDKWHTISTRINANNDGCLILTSKHEYMPPGAKYGYEIQRVIDLKLELYWDEDAQWFGMRNLGQY